MGHGLINCSWVGKFIGPKEGGQGSRHGKGDRGEGKEKEKTLVQKEGKRDREPKKPGFYREEPFGQGQPSPMTGKFMVEGLVC